MDHKLQRQHHVLKGEHAKDLFARGNRRKVEPEGGGGESDVRAVGDGGDDAEPLQEVEPDADVARLPRHGAPHVAAQLGRVEAD